MRTIVTHVTVREGAEPEWEAAMRDRLDGAKTQPGWRGGQLLMPTAARNKRVLSGSWETRSAWEAWHTDDTFQETRPRLEGLEAEPNQQWWHEVIRDIHP